VTPPRWATAAAASFVLVATACTAGPGGLGGLATSGAASPTPAVASAVLITAGDVACGPDVEITPEQCQQEATADLVEGLNPDAVLVLGDTAYEEVTPETLKGYDASWGRFLDKTHSVVGNH